MFLLDGVSDLNELYRFDLCCQTAGGLLDSTTPDTGSAVTYFVRTRLSCWTVPFPHNNFNSAGQSSNHCSLLPSTSSFSHLLLSPQAANISLVLCERSVSSLCSPVPKPAARSDLLIVQNWDERFASTSLTHFRRSTSSYYRLAS